ncbi:MAG TPA: lipopolysaccharide heptosyltransferase II [Gemmatimonadales bacterium]
MTSLAIQTAFLGDVVLTTPLLRVLAQRHGPVDVVTTPAAAPLLAHHPAVRTVIPYDKRGTDAGMRGLLTLARRLRGAHYEVAYVPHRSLRSALLARLAGVPRRVGYADGWPFFYTERRTRPGGGHEVDRLLALADAPDADRRPSLAVTDAEEASAARALAEGGLSGAFVALAPGSIWGTKRWPGFPALAARLAGAGDGIVVIGGPEDRTLGAEIARAVAGAAPRGAVVNACGTLSLRESAAVIARARVLVTNDSAPLHLAQAMGTPTVALFGPTVPAFGFAPLNPGDAALGVEGLACRPCSPHGPARCPLGHHRCMTALPVEQVLAAIEETGAIHRRG